MAGELSTLTDLIRLSVELIHEAVNDPEWQKFRLSLKGLNTEAKLNKLGTYIDETDPAADSQENLYRYVRVQNYLNALSRGGQIEPIDPRMTLRDNISHAMVLK